MINHPNRTPTARSLAKAAGYYVREGSYQGTTDDRLGRWYFGHQDDNGFRPYGAGHATQKAAWEAALEHGCETRCIQVEGGDTPEDRDTGYLVHVAGDQATVAWDSGVRTTQHISLLRTAR